MSTCPWCGEPFEAVKRGPHAKRFCSAECKNQWNSAARTFGRMMESKGILNLRAWQEGRQNAPRSVVHDAGVPKSPSGAGG